MLQQLQQSQLTYRIITVIPPPYTTEVNKYTDSIQDNWISKSIFNYLDWLPPNIVI